MKLYELINFDPVDSKTNRRKYHRKISGNTKSSEIGDGAFSLVYDTNSGKRLNQVTKLGTAGNLNHPHTDDSSQDGYLQYLLAVQNSAKTNPYFPKIHDLKIMKDSKGKLSYRANIEKLVRFTSSKIADNDELMMSIHNDMFETPMREIDRDPGVIARIISNKLESAVDYGFYSDIKDPELYSAIKLIRGVVATNPQQFQADVHIANIMWRITGNRPQLVIIDPIA